MKTPDRSKHPVSRAVPTIAVAAVLACAPLSGASAYTLQTLHNFCSWANCQDGETGKSAPVMDSSGNLYNTTLDGGKYGQGVILKLVPNGGAWKEYVLHNFCVKSGCVDGAGPVADLILDVDGNLYGTATFGGQHGAGIVFKATHGANGWAFRVLHNFTGSDGNSPSSRLSYAGQASGQPWDTHSSLFGTTDTGGAYNHGVAYELWTSGSVWNYTVIHNFNTSSGPQELLVDASGNLFGATVGGGQYGGGLMFKLARDTWKETLLHQFCQLANCLDGSAPVGRMAMDGSGNLFGVTYLGGSGPPASCFGYGGCGVVFERTSGGTYSVIYNFCSLANCADGAVPSAGVERDSSGHLFGITIVGGVRNTDYAGVVYELSSNSGNWTESVLYPFCSQANCADGEAPEGIMLDPLGNVFGSAFLGGAHNNAGTMYELTP